MSVRHHNSRPRPMKQTLHSRHHSTVLPRLGAIMKEILQNLQDYKLRLFGEPSDICTDSGASPQDVRHLFAYNTHPTDLSHEDLWRNPVGSIRKLSYLDDRNLD